jgi:CheY-like chemotaxis protein
MFHIFIVDDNVANSALLLLAFKRARPDASVYTVSDSRLLPAYLDTKSPVEAVRAAHPDILVLSKAMSFYSGLETLAWIREQPRFESMFVVMLSSSDDPAERAQAEIAGVNAFHVWCSGSKALVPLAQEIIQEYTQSQSTADQAVLALTPTFAVAI